MIYVKLKFEKNYMKNNYSLDEILNAINDLHKIKKEKKIDQVKENKNMSQNLDIPKNTLKLIEEAEKSKN